MCTPITAIEGVDLIASKQTGIATVDVRDFSAKQSLPWDRYVRLQAGAQALLACTPAPKTVLDAGGYDGAIGLFLPGLTIDVVDPATTGGSILEIPAPQASYDALAAIDVLEHIEPAQRQKVLSELARVADRHVVLNYPSAGSRAAQELMLKLTGNPFIKEHVQWALPDTRWVVATMESFGFSCSTFPHSSLAVWLGQFLVQNKLADEAAQLNRFLVEHFSQEPFSAPLYELVVCSRS